VAGLTPGGSWKLAGERGKDRFANRFVNLLVLDEASQMSLPEAAMAAVPLELDGQLIVVGDHRQMPPIVQHDWKKEARRSFKEFAAYESLYLALDRLTPEEHKIRFSESFRLHRDMAEFLKREIYYQDGINFFSNRVDQLALTPNGDSFAEAVLGPEPLVVIAHDEMASQTSNAFEQLLVDRLVRDLGGFDPVKGMGVVVPHRAQRATLQDAIKELSVRDPVTGAVTLSSVDTVERFQGDERRVIIVSLTESDPHFIRTTSEFLLDPRRLTVALSRAKEKMIVIASRSVFGVIAGDEETFVNAGLWKNLLRRTCTETRWSGAIEGHQVDVRVNPPLIS
jgi:superfamily I DNA and/or RNA helicase